MTQFRDAASALSSAIQHEFKPHPECLRDWFAGLAMVALVHEFAEADEPSLARWAYDQSDAMMEARKPLTSPAPDA